MPWSRMSALTRWGIRKWVRLTRTTDVRVAGCGTPRVVAVSTREPSLSKPTVTETLYESSLSRISYVPETSLKGETKKVFSVWAVSVSPNSRR